MAVFFPSYFVSSRSARNLKRRHSYPRLPSRCAFVFMHQITISILKDPLVLFNIIPTPSLCFLFPKKSPNGNISYKWRVPLFLLFSFAPDIPLKKNLYSFICLACRRLKCNRLQCYG